MSPTSLRLFPSPYIPPNSSLTNGVPGAPFTAADDDRGLHRQHSRSARSTPKTESPSETVQPSSTRETPSPQRNGRSGAASPGPQSDSPNRNASKPRVVTRRPSNGLADSPYTNHLDSSIPEEDELGELPMYLSTSTSPKRSQSPQLNRPILRNKSSKDSNNEVRHTSPTSTQVDSKPASVTEKKRFSRVSASTNDYSGSFLGRTASPFETASSIASTNQTDSTAIPRQPIQSMFPMYDHSRPLNQQRYYPTTQVPSMTTVGSDKISKQGSPVEKHSLKRFDSAVGLVDGYEHIPAAEYSDLVTLWKASCDQPADKSRKMQLSLYQVQGCGTALAIGITPEQPIFSLKHATSLSSSKHLKPRKEMVVNKHCPTERSSAPVSHLALPDRSSSNAACREIVSIFPEASTDLNASTALFDPDSKSDDIKMIVPDQDIIANKRYRCSLVLRVRKRDSLGSVTACYDLNHPELGSLTITVTKSYSPQSPRNPRAKISLHHPSATPTAVAADTLNLAFLDFARDACVLDVPGLLALNKRYIVDTVMSAMMAVAVIENDALVAESLKFDAPPREAINDSKRNRRTSSAFYSSSSNKSKPAKTKKQKKKGDNASAIEEQVDLPIMAQGALAVIGVSFKAAVVLLSAGAKVTSEMVVGASHLAKKL